MSICKYYVDMTGAVTACASLTAQLVEMRIRRMDTMLCTENVGPEIFGKLLQEVMDRMGALNER